MARGWRKHDDYNWQAFGQWIEESRKSLSLQRTVVAEALGISPGTMKHVADGTRGLDRERRQRLVDMLIDPLEKGGRPVNRRSVLKLAGLAAGLVASSPMRPPQLLTRKYRDTYLLDKLQSRVVDWKHNLYEGNAHHVGREANYWYDALLSGDLPQDDPSLAEIAIECGLLVGKAQELVLPWFTRSPAAIRTYDDVQIRVIERFPLDRFRLYRAQLSAAKGSAYRLLGLHENSLHEYNDGLLEVQAPSQLNLRVGILRQRAHLWATLGEEHKWKGALDDLQFAIARSTHPQQSQLLAMTTYVRGEGCKRLAYSTGSGLSDQNRVQYARQAIAYIVEAQKSLADWQPENGHIGGVDGHPLNLQVSVAQCLVWIDPHEARRIMTLIRPDVERMFPSLLAKMSHTDKLVDMRLAWKRGNSSPELRLDPQ